MKAILHTGLFILLLWAFATGCKKVTELQPQYIYLDSSRSNGPEFIITNYGAKGDGKTDCSGIINDLITKLPASGGTIVIPEGDFLLSKPIKVTRNFVTIRGQNSGLRSNVDIPPSYLINTGGGSKLIVGAASTGIEVPVLPDVNGRKNRISGVVIKNLLIAGSNPANTVGINILHDNDGLRINNVIGINLETGIISNASDALVIQSCWISECRNSIRLRNGIQNMITGCQLGAQPGGVTVNLENEENFNFTGNHVYPDGDVNLQLNNCRFNNISSNNFQSYYIGILEVNEGYSNLVSSNLFWMRLPGDTARQSRGMENTYGVIRVSGNDHFITNNSITCNWASPNQNPVTVRSVSGAGNRYQSLKVNDTRSSRVFYVNENCQILDCVPATHVFVEGDPSKVYIRY
jgi:hypothetical protein